MSNKLGPLGNLARGLAFILSAPAGCGKTTLVDLLVKQQSVIAQSISCTTRAPRPYEVNGVHYHFLDTHSFEEKSMAGDFLEEVRLFGNCYGTLRSHVEELRNAGKHVFLVIDTQGALKIMRTYDAISIFLMPPSLDELLRRLQCRGTESAENLEKRLARAREEIGLAPLYDYTLVNDDLDCALSVITSIVIAEEHRNRKK